MQLTCDVAAFALLGIYELAGEFGPLLRGGLQAFGHLVEHLRDALKLAEVEAWQPA